MRICHVGSPGDVGGVIGRAQREMGHDVDIVFAREHPAGYDYDRLLKLPTGLRWLELRDYDVVHLHSFRLLPHAAETLLPGKVVLHHHGSDVRGKGPPFFARFLFYLFIIFVMN